MDIVIGLAIATLVTVVLWGVAFATRRAPRDLVVPGLIRGAVAALVIYAATVFVVTISIHGISIVELDLAGSFTLGLLVGLVIAGGFFWIGAALMALGLLVRRSEMWTHFGTWLAVPIIAASLGFAYQAYQNVQQRSQSPTVTRGTLSLDAHGARLGDVRAAGNAKCSLAIDGTLTIASDPNSGVPSFVSTDGRLTEVAVGAEPSGAVAGLLIVVGDAQAVPGKGWDTGPDTTVLRPGWTRAGGRLDFTNVVPLDPATNLPDANERWSGSVDWTCASG